MSKKTYKLTLPLSIAVSKKKNLGLNLNSYRNTHFHVLNKMKRVYELAIRDMVNELPKFELPITLHYVLFPKTKRLCDVSNVCSIVDKFFCDTLTQQGRIEDDNYQFVPHVSYSFGAVDKENPRVEVTIIEVSGWINTIVENLIQFWRTCTKNCTKQT